MVEIDPPADSDSQIFRVWLIDSITFAIAVCVKCWVQCQVIRELLFADDYALPALTENEAQELFDLFSDAVLRF